MYREGLGDISKYGAIAVYQPRKFRNGKVVGVFYRHDCGPQRIIEWSYKRELANLRVRDLWSGDDYPALEYVDRLHKQQDRAELERTLKGRELAIYRLEQEIRG